MINFDIVMSFLQKGLSFVVVFAVLVFVHELGHFTLARLNGIHVYEFAIGMGKVIYSYQGKVTKYSLRIFPIGGFVNMMGESEESDDPASFSVKKPWQRFSVLFAGPFMNFVLALFLFCILFGIQGVPVNVISNVLEGYPAAEAGLKEGDKIIKIASEDITTWNEVIDNIALNSNNNFDITFIRDHQEQIVNIETLAGEDGRKIIGIEPALNKSPSLIVGQSFEYLTDMVKNIFAAFTKLFKGKSSGDEFVGPVGIVKIVGETSQYGLLALIHLTAILSINLGFVNLIPFPALDGGRLVFVIYEMIFRKPFNQEKEQNLHYAGIVILLLLMLFLVTKDIINLR